MKKRIAKKVLKNLASYDFAFSVGRLVHRGETLRRAFERLPKQGFEAFSRVMIDYGRSRGMGFGPLDDLDGY